MCDDKKFERVEIHQCESDGFYYLVIPSEFKKNGLAYSLIRTNREAVARRAQIAVNCYAHILERREEENV